MGPSVEQDIASVSTPHSSQRFSPIGGAVTIRTILVNRSLGGYYRCRSVDSRSTSLGGISMV
jgi:hypothetical protein